jgi:hypothetical protein
VKRAGIFLFHCFSCTEIEEKNTSSSFFFLHISFLEDIEEKTKNEGTDGISSFRSFV